ncbi:MAG TPA: helicase-associated domain-containing protein, partial [Microbacterium sp.]|uniref:helicase-associated domain-containing protein n=1 Tax=Microbacterium sp. TaxID=51671 RepID=UPI002B45A182
GTGTAAERAAASVASLADILVASRIRPLTTTAVESVTAAERRRLVDEGVIAETTDLDDLLAAAAAAGLVVLREREWRLTTDGDAWLLKDAVSRWTGVAAGILSLLPRDASGQVLPPDAWAGAHPLDPAGRARASDLYRLAARWGILTATGDAPAWSHALWHGGEVDAAALAERLTPEIDGIYLQADLSAIAPGPMQPALDLRLRTMAERESRAQASTYRFSEQSLASAVAAGETAESLRAFLGGLSLTGIPQPLDYLIDQVTSGRGMLRVGTDAPTGRARVDSDDPHLLDMLLVDRALRPLGLHAAEAPGGALLSRVSRDAVYWSLVDARYRVTALDADGAPESLNRRRPLVSPDDDPPADDLLPLAERLLAGRGDSDAAWLERELDQAVRLRAAVVLTVLLPDGSTRELAVEAQGLGGGRFRGLDRAADVERTVPLAAIASVRPA